jgi:D-psicose/D-tagatose/L-ribulose 3-epimerase
VNPLGANTWIWVSPLTDDRLATLAPRIRDWGFDVIELPIEQPDDWDPGRAADLLASLGLGATTCAVMPPGRDLVIDDDEVVHATQEYLRTCIRIAERVGAVSVCGPLYAPVGRTWLLDPAGRAATLARLAEHLAPLADYAGERGVMLGIEPLNRYETSLINTVEQALEVVALVDSPALGVAIDAFHMNIEETDPAAAIRSASGHIAHIQVAGSHRGAPGNDHLPWPAMRDAIVASGYEGPVCIESFTAENQTIARAAAIWRRLEPTQDAIATDGIAFLRELFASPTSAPGGRP